VKKEHLYRVTLEQLDAVSPDAASRQLQLDFGNHDDIFSIIEIERQAAAATGLSADDGAMLVVGLKLFGKVIMSNRGNELFSAFEPHFIDFMKNLKKNLKKDATEK
jgi:hypothetical protein